MNSASSTLNALLIGVIVVAIMYFARDVLVPLALAGILSFILAVPVRALQRLRLPRPLAVVVVVAVAFAAIFGLGRILARQVEDLASDLPKYQATIQEKIQGLRGLQKSGAETLERAQVVLRRLDRELEESQNPGDLTQAASPAPTDRNLIPVAAPEPLGGPVRTLIGLVSPLLAPLATTTLIIVFVIFILIQREDLRDRVIRLAGSTDIPHAIAALDDAAHRLSHLFLTQITINSGFGALIGLGLWRIGVPSAIVWGVLAGIFRFVPFVGALLGLIFPLVLAVGVGSGWSMALWTVALFAGVEGMTGQVVEPVFLGRTTGLTPLAIVAAATFWSWIWGPVGLVLATPLTVILVVLGRHVEALKFFDILLGDEPALSDSEALYQRMLAHDPIEAIEHAKTYMTNRSLAAYCDDVVRQALALARKDVERGALEGETLAAFRQTVERLFADIAHEHWVSRREKRARKDAPGGLPIVPADARIGGWTSARPLVSIGAHDPLDEAAACVVATLAETHGIPTRIERPHGLGAAHIEALDLGDAALVCLTSLDLKTPGRVKYAARRIRTKAPQAKLMLGLWTASDDSAVESLKDLVEADFAFRSFGDAATAILEEATGKPLRPAPPPTAAGDGKKFADAPGGGSAGG